MSEKSRLIVIKLGSQVVASDSSNNQKALLALLQPIANFVRTGNKVVLVSSGAIAFGRNDLNYGSKLNLAQRQAAAAVGQPKLIAFYQEQFAAYNLHVAQVLLTADDFSKRQRYLNIRQVFAELFNKNVLPIINENDCVATAEIEDLNSKETSFGDNDRLAALLAVNLKADLLVLLSNVDGLYDSNPFENSAAQLVSNIASFSELNKYDTSGNSALGRGGMTSKVLAAKIAASGGVPVFLGNGFKPQILEDLLIHQDYNNITGTKIATLNQPLSAKKSWIGFASGFNGKIKINTCATSVFKEGRCSLLAVGVEDVQGKFESGTVVQILGDDGNEIARGVSEFSSADIRLIMGKSRSQISEISNNLGHKLDEVVIHKDYLVNKLEYES